MVPSAHSSPQPKRHLDRFSHFCTVHGDCRRGCLGKSFPLKIAFRTRGPGPHLIHTSLDPPESITQTVQPCLHSARQSVVWHVGVRPSPSKLLFFMGRSRDLNPHLIRGSLCPPDSAVQTASRPVLPILHSSRQTVPILYNGPPLFPQNTPSHGGSGHHLIHGSSTETASRSVQPFLHAQYCDIQTDRPSDHAILGR